MRKGLFTSVWETRFGVSNNTCDLYGPRNPCQQIQELVTSKLLLLMRPIYAHRWVRPGDLGGYRNNYHTSENEREILGNKGEVGRGKRQVGIQRTER